MKWSAALGFYTENKFLVKSKIDFDDNKDFEDTADQTNSDQSYQYVVDVSNG